MATPKYAVQFVFCATFVGWAALGCGVPGHAAEPIGLTVESAVALSREFLTADDEQRDRLTSKLVTYTGPIEAVLAALTARSYPAVESGYYQAKSFESPALQDKYPDALLYFRVPENYDPAKPTGLIVFLHGGGIDTSPEAPHYSMRWPRDDSPPDTDRSGDMLAATGMITVGPSAPGEGESWYRWCLKASEPYLADVIAECKHRFNIDADRVFLLGHSMGGFGAFHHAQRQPDRFAAIISSSGAWDCGYWPVLRGTPFFLANGVHDAVKGERKHHTDVQFGRRTHKIFTRENLEHIYYEHDGGHNFSNNRAAIAEFIQSMSGRRRDPYYSHVAVATPQGFTWNYLNPVRHNRWLSLDEAADGRITCDELVERGEDFDSWRLEPRRTRRRGAVVDAVLRGGNYIDVTTQNVSRFTVWLHPKMVDITRPVTVMVDGQVRFSGMVRPSLVTALQSYERRHDWGLIYSMKVEVDLDQ